MLVFVQTLDEQSFLSTKVNLCTISCGRKSGVVLLVLDDWKVTCYEVLGVIHTSSHFIVCSHL